MRFGANFARASTTTNSEYMFKIPSTSLRQIRPRVSLLAALVTNNTRFCPQICTVRMRDRRKNRRG